MKIITVSYSKTYPTGAYANEKIGMEATIDETQEKVSDALFQLRHYCDEIHKKNNPHLYQEQDQLYNQIVEGAKYRQEMASITNIRPPESSEKISPEQETEALMLAISEATAEELPQYQLLAAKNQKTMGAYNKRKKQLNIQ